MVNIEIYPLLIHNRFNSTAKLNLHQLCKNNTMNEIAFMKSKICKVNKKQQPKINKTKN